MFVERWTIDEIGDGVVRVLAARSLDPTALGLLGERSRALPAPVMGDSERVASAAEVMAVQLGTAAPLEPEAEADIDGPPTEPVWTDEQDSVLDLESLAAFVTRFREQVPGAVERPLRETDVFWVVATDVPARVLAEQDGPRRRMHPAHQARLVAHRRDARELPEGSAHTALPKLGAHLIPDR